MPLALADFGIQALQILARKMEKLGAPCWAALILRACAECASKEINVTHARLAAELSSRSE